MNYGASFLENVLSKKYGRSKRKGGDVRKRERENRAFF